MFESLLEDCVGMTDGELDEAIRASELERREHTARRAALVAVIAHVTNFEHGRTSEMIHVLQYDDAVERLRRLVLFDMDDLDVALAEMERLQNEIESAS